MDYLIDGHVHLEYGPLSKEYVKEFVDEAINKGISKLQILDHTHRFKEFLELYEPLRNIDIQNKWLSNKEKKFKDSLNDYLSLIKEVKKEKYPIDISFGLEVCYIKEKEDFLRNLLNSYQFDFLVGAIHSIDGILYDMDFSKELLWENKDVNEIYEHYYDSLISLVKSGLFNQLAHPDTIKLFNYYPTYDLSDTYQLLSEELNKQDMYAECNVGCMYRYNHKDLGLSDELLKTFIKNDVKLITASDGHHPNEVGTLIKEANNKIIKFKKELKNV